MMGYTSFLDEASFVVGCAVGGCTGFAVADFGVRVAKMFSGTLAGAVVRITLRCAGLGRLVPDIAVFAAGLVIFLGAVFIVADIMCRAAVQIAEIAQGLQLLYVGVSPRQQTSAPSSGPVSVHSIKPSQVFISYLYFGPSQELQASPTLW